MHTDQPIVVFKPRIDWWVMIIALLYLFFLLACVPFVLWYSNAPLYVTILAALFLAFSAVSLVDKTCYTTYVLADKDLQIHSHLRLFRVSYRAIDRISYGGLLGLFGIGSNRRFALSRKNISISIRGGSIRKISLSPNERDAFVHQLMNRIDSERSSRAVRDSYRGKPKSLFGRLKKD